MRAFLGEPLSVDALRSDAYVESLLASAERRAPAVPTDVDLDPEVAAMARVLQSTLVRVHPSFRFEEHLAWRLAAVAAAMRRDATAAAAGPTSAACTRPAAESASSTAVGPTFAAVPGADRSIVAFPRAGPWRDDPVEEPLRGLGAAARPVVAWASAGAIAASVVARLPLPAPAVRPESGPTIAGAVAMTSAAISLGVAAFVAWRRGRMGRGIA